jgi:cell division septum initiation protein DivIVA
MCLQGLKNKLAGTDDPEAEQLRAEIDELEQRIEGLTEFSSGQAFHISSEGG